MGSRVRVPPRSPIIPKYFNGLGRSDIGYLSCTLECVHFLYTSDAPTKTRFDKKNPPAHIKHTGGKQRFELQATATSADTTDVSQPDTYAQLVIVVGFKMAASISS